MLVSCGAPEEFTETEEANIDQLEQPVFWNPSSALVTEHVNWHTGGRKPTNQGEDFLIFHRDFIRRLRADYESKGLTANIDPWYVLPAAMKTTQYWIARQTALNTAEANIYALRNAAGQPFASLNEFGTYLETFYHGHLHGAAQELYGGSPGCTTPNTDCIVGGFMSPQSTYFFKIHGLVDWHMERFLKSDFNHDGKADLFVRNPSTGVNQVRLQNGTTTTSTVTLPTVSPSDGCNWYLGATADFNFDGWNDLVWHGPGCSATSVWLMNGTTYSSSVALPGVNSSFLLYGAGDFTKDNRPDLVWRNVSTGEIHIWRMSGTTYLNTITIPLALSNGGISLVGDFNDNGSPDFLLRRTGSNGGMLYDIQYMSGTTLSTKSAVTGMSVSPYHSPQAAGRYSNDRYIDIAMLADAPTPLPKTYNHFFQLFSGTLASTATTTQATGTNLAVRGPR